VKLDYEKQIDSVIISELNSYLQDRSPQEILSWAWSTFGYQVVASSSFQTQSVPLLHMIGNTTPQLPVIFLDTGFHFSETLQFRDVLQQQFGLNILNVQPELNPQQLAKEHGEKLYDRNPSLCCHLNKVEPMKQAVKGLRAWITGVRADQTARRRQLNVIELQEDGLIKIHPLLNWTKKDVWEYVDEHRLPAHPLLEKGYVSVGCAPCTRPVFAGENERAGRWRNMAKTECGLHT